MCRWIHWKKKWTFQKELEHSNYVSLEPLKNEICGMKANYKTILQLGMVVHTYNSRIQEAKVGELKIQR
jgi:hypothetical protein